ncbi:hypothetical protein DN745_01560 [Bradymonas sediminis]|uniref:Uncharacterized protein n=2 Tax=Bradymonas sediminis TaxID=1548548 RepID=A0A2Z4FGK3_9DELT|nr:hypothetical protein DN745_01560 [Bradymonas sediminis]
MRGEDVDALESPDSASNAASGPPCGTADIAQVTWSGASKPGQAQPPAPAPSAGVEAQLGREVFEMLRASNLPGPARAAAANLLCEQLHWLESSPGAAPSAAEMANGLRKVLSILVTTQFE